MPKQENPTILVIFIFVYLKSISKTQQPFEIILPDDQHLDSNVSADEYHKTGAWRKIPVNWQTTGQFGRERRHVPVDPVAPLVGLLP